MKKEPGKILFDLMAAQPNRASYHGASEYTKTVFLRLAAKKGERKMVAAYDPNRSLSESVQEAASDADIELVPCKSIQELHDLVASGGVEKFYSALPYKYSFFHAPAVKFVWTVHGLREIECPTDRYERRFLRTRNDFKKYATKVLAPIRHQRSKKNIIRALLSVDCAELSIVVPSCHTKYSLYLEALDLLQVSVQALSSPVREQLEIGELPDGAQLQDRFGLASRGFFLITSAGRWIKNAYRATNAMDDLISRGLFRDRMVVVCGVARDQRDSFKVRNKSYFRFFDYVSDQDLSALYAHAYALVYPSLNEGYGYPPVEAMKYGTPVLAAANTAIPEVCGDAALYFETRDERELSVRVLTLIEEEGLWDIMSRRATDRYLHLYERQQKDLDELCDLILS